MAQLTFNIPDDRVQEFLNLLASLYGYDGYLEFTQDDPPLSKQEFVRQRLRDLIKREVERAYRQTQPPPESGIDVSA